VSAVAIRSPSSTFPISTASTGSASTGEHPETRTFGELLIDLEGDRAYKAVIWGLLREMARDSP